MPRWRKKKIKDSDIYHDKIEFGRILDTNYKHKNKPLSSTYKFIKKADKGRIKVLYANSHPKPPVKVFWFNDWYVNYMTTGCLYDGLTLFRLRFKNGQTQSEQVINSESIMECVPSDNNEILAVNYNDGRIEIYDRNFKLIKEDFFPERANFWLYWSQDNSKLLGRGMGENASYVLDLNSQKSPYLEPNFATDPHFSRHFPVLSQTKNQCIFHHNSEEVIFKPIHSLTTWNLSKSGRIAFTASKDFANSCIYDFSKDRRILFDEYQRFFTTHFVSDDLILYRSYRNTLNLTNLNNLTNDEIITLGGPYFDILDVNPDGDVLAFLQNIGGSYKAGILLFRINKFGASIE